MKILPYFDGWLGAELLRYCDARGHELVTHHIDADVAISAGWTTRIKVAGLSCPAINVHPSPLPAFRGARPLIRQLAGFATHSALTVHLMDAGFDTGPILVQRFVTLPRTDNLDDVGDAFRAVLPSTLDCALAALEHAAPQSALARWRTP